MTVSLDRQIACAERELALRRSTYPKWVKAARISETKAAEEITAMEAIVRTLKWFRENENDLRACVEERKAVREIARTDPTARALMEAFPDAKVTVREATQ